jgi:hypothetical protein
MITSGTIKPVDLDDVRLATGGKVVRAKSMLTFPTSEMVTVMINGGLVYWVNQRPIEGRDFG